MNPQRWQRIQEWYDGGGSPTERREVEDWLRDDPEVRSLVAQFELQGETLREAIAEEVATMKVGGMWQAIEAEITKVEPAWVAMQKAGTASIFRPDPVAVKEEAGAGEELSLRGLLLAMSAALALVVVVSLVQPSIRGGQESEPAKDDLVTKVDLPKPDHTLEIDSMDVDTGTVLVYAPPENSPAIIWVSYDEQ